MKRSSLYRLILLVAAGGMLFQTTGGCKSQAIDLLLSSIVPAVTTALTTALGGALTSGITT